MNLGINVGLFGASGRMGRMIIELICLPNRLLLSESRQQKSKTSPALEEKLDVWIDFSHTDALPSHIARALDYKIPIVIGTTGHSDHNFFLMHEASQKIPLLFSPNFSLGMAWIKKQLAGLCTLFPESVKDITDFHHENKRDLPSGTALMLSEQIQDPVRFHSYRLPGITAEHQVLISTLEESIEISHKVLNRSVFAKGALDAADFLVHQPNGFYTFDDVISHKLLQANTQLEVPSHETV